MSTAVLTDWSGEGSLRFKARMAGVFQLLEALTAGSGEVLVLGRLVVAGNAAATAANILGHAVILVGVCVLAHRGWVPYRLGASPL